MTREEIEADIKSFAVLFQDVAYRQAQTRNYGPSPTCDALERAIARLRADLAKRDGPADGFVRVRIGVAVDSDGLWVAAGDHGADDMEIVDRQLLPDNGDAISWVIADVPLPRFVEVEGTVE